MNLAVNLMPASILLRVWACEHETHVCIGNTVSVILLGRF
jgi:hypothetical protein